MKLLMQSACVAFTLLVFSLFWTGGALAVPTAATLQPEGTVSRSGAATHAIPFVYDPVTERNIVVQVRIGKHDPMLFLVDTGSAIPVLVEPWAAKELGLPAKGSPFNLNPGNGTGYIAPPQDMAVAGAGQGTDWIIQQTPVYVADLDFLNETTFVGRKAGVIGLPLLKAANLQIDFPHRQLLFLPTINAPTVPPGSTEVALRPSADPALYNALLPAIPGSLAPPDGLPLLLDTGSDACLLPPYFIPDLHPTVATMMGQITIAGSGTITDYFVPSLKFGPITAANVLVGEASSTLGLLGLNVLSQFVVTLDWAGQRMWLTPTAALVPAVPGAKDIHLTEEGGHLLVDQVVPGSPAAQAGLRSGQKVLRVDGRDTDGVGGTEVEWALTGYAASTAKVTVEDSIGRHDIVFKRRSLVDPASYDGLRLRLIPTEYAHTGWSVETLLCASPCYQQGMRPGDIIAAVGKTNIERMPLRAVEQLLRNTKPGTEMKVGRPETVPLPIGTSATSPLPDLSGLKPDVRRLIEDLLKQGFTATKNPNGGFTMTRPKDTTPATNAGNTGGNGAAAGDKPGAH